MVNIVYFTATWCGPCKTLAPIMEQIGREIPAVTIEKIDVDSNRDKVQEYKVTSVPTLCFLKNGVLVERIIGVRPKNMLVENITRLL